MPALSRTVALLLAAVLPATTQAQSSAKAQTPAQTQAPASRAQVIPAAAASTRATVEVAFNGRMIGGKWSPGAAATAGPALVRIDYGQPSARGRRVEGSLVPIDEVWRLGANMSTQLTTEVDWTVGTTTIPRGVYSLFLLNNGKGATLIVNKQVGQWGTEYDAKQDLLRIPLKLRPLLESIETLSIWLVPSVSAPTREGQAAAPPTAPQGVLKIAWGKSEWWADWQVGK